MNRELRLPATLQPLYRLFCICTILFCNITIYAKTITVTSNSDSGPNSLRQAITDINNESDSLNIVNIQIPGNSPILLSSDLPVIKKNIIINSTDQQIINGKSEYRLFATIMADLTLTNCTLQNGAAIGGDGGISAGGGMGAGGGVYIDRGNQLTLTAITINNCKSQGGRGDKDHANYGNGGGASFSSANKDAQLLQGGGDYPGHTREIVGGDGAGGKADGSSYMNGYGGGDGTSAYPSGRGGGSGSGIREMGGYCGGGAQSKGGGGGNGGAAAQNSSYYGGGGGFGSGGAYLGGGGGFGGGGSG